MTLVVVLLATVVKGSANTASAGNQTVEIQARLSMPCLPIRQLTVLFHRFGGIGPHNDEALGGFWASVAQSSHQKRASIRDIRGVRGVLMQCRGRKYCGGAVRVATGSRLGDDRSNQPAGGGETAEFIGQIGRRFGMDGPGVQLTQMHRISQASRTRAAGEVEGDLHGNAYAGAPSSLVGGAR